MKTVRCLSPPRTVRMYAGSQLELVEFTAAADTHTVSDRMAAQLLRESDFEEVPS